MTFWERVKQFFSRASPGGGGNSGAVGYLRGDYSLSNSEIIYAAVSRISNALSAMPVSLVKNMRSLEPGDSLSRLNDLVGFSPNPNMVSSDFFKTLEAVRDTNGNAYALKVYSPPFTLERLDVIDPAKVSPVLNDDTGEIWYRVQSAGGELLLHNFYILHFKFISTNGYIGISPVAVLRDALDYEANIERLSVRHLERGISNAVVLSAPTALGDKQRESAINTIVDTYKKTGGNILMLESGITANSLNLSPVDSHAFDVERITRSRVAMVYNIPPHLLGDYSDTSFTTMEQQQLEFMQLTMLPIVTMYEQILNKGLLTAEQRAEGYRFRFDMNAMLRGDTAARAEANFKAIRSAWMTPNEIRVEDGKPPDPDGDDLLASKDLVPLKFLGEMARREGEGNRYS